MNKKNLIVAWLIDISNFDKYKNVKIYKNIHNIPILTLLISLLLFQIITAASCSNEVEKTNIKFPELQQFQSIFGKVVFVSKDIYGGDLSYSCSLRGKIRNVSTKPYKDIYIIWAILDKDKKLFLVSSRSGETPSAFISKIDYLDTKAEAEFNIFLDLYSDITSESANKIKEAIQNNRQEASIYIKKR